MDAKTVRVTTPAENPLVPYRLASVNTGILAPAAYAGESLDPFGHCTGPFAPVSEKAQQSLTLDRNENYWGGDVQLAGAEVRFITNGATRAAQVQTGEADISLSIPVASLAALESADGVKVLKADSPRTATLYLNNGRAPLNNVDVRTAIRRCAGPRVAGGQRLRGCGPPGHRASSRRPNPGQATSRKPRSRTWTRPRSCWPTPATPRPGRWRSSPSWSGRSSPTWQPSSRKT